MMRITAKKAQGEFPEVLDRVQSNRERIVVRKRGKDVAVLIPVEDLALLKELEKEELLDARQAKRRLMDPREVPIPYARARKELGLD